VLLCAREEEDERKDVVRKTGKKSKEPASTQARAHSGSSESSNAHNQQRRSKN
jgi:hypothetical protein